MDPHRYNRHSMFLRKDNSIPRFDIVPSIAVYLSFSWLFLFVSPDHFRQKIHHTEEDVGLLVQVSFDITAFTLPAYQRGSLPRPSKDDSS